MNIYQSNLMDHYRNPHNRKVLDEADFASGNFNPSCGDSVSLQGNVKDGILQELYFDGFGCVISQAAASMLTQYAQGKSLDALQKIGKDEILGLIQTPLGPNRLRCALLCVEALHRGIERYLGQ